MPCKEKAKRTQPQNARELLQILFAVQPVTSLAAIRRDETALLVILQRARRDLKTLGGVANSQKRGLRRHVNALADT